jgi:hypothetical protein
MWTSGGPVTVTPLAEPDSLGALPFTLARDPVRIALRWYSQATAFDSWTTTAQAAALKETVCARDDLPEVGAIDPSVFLPFLSLSI